MNMKKLSIGLVSSVVALLALGACNEVRANDLNIVTYKDSNGNQVGVLTNDIYNKYRKSTDGISKFYSSILESIIRHEFDISTTPIYKKSKEEEGDEEGDDEESKEGDSDEKAEDTKPSKTKTKKGSDSPTTPPPPPPEEDDKEEESKEEGDEEEKDDEEEKTDKLPDEHDKTDWSKLEDIDDKEFIEKSEADKYIAQINELKRTKFRLTQITQMLNGLATTTRQRTYAMPSMIQIDERTMLKGRKPGKTSLYLIFDASGSMGEELATFKEIISKSIPQAMNCPCEWFSGYPGTAPVSSIRYNKRYLDRTYGDYYKGKFKDIMPIRASGGYDDDGDRTLELCYLAEQAGYTPIGVTDGGGCVIDHDETKEQIKRLKRTVLVGQNERWFNKVKSINPGIRTICL